MRTYNFYIDFTNGIFRNESSDNIIFVSGDVDSTKFVFEFADYTSGAVKLLIQSSAMPVAENNALVVVDSTCEYTVSGTVLASDGTITMSMQQIVDDTVLTVSEFNETMFIRDSLIEAPLTAGEVTITNQLVSIVNSLISDIDDRVTDTELATHNTSISSHMDIRGYIDTMDAEVLVDAKAYTNSKAEITQKDADVLTGAESYTDSEITEHNTSESSHSDIRTAITDGDSAALLSAQSYTYPQADIDSKVAGAIALSGSIADDKISAHNLSNTVHGDIRANIASADIATLNSAKDYTYSKADIAQRDTNTFNLMETSADGKITSHNISGESHSDIRNLVPAHNINTSAHTDIRDSISSSVSALRATLYDKSETEDLADTVLQAAVEASGSNTLVYINSHDNSSLAHENLFDEKVDKVTGKVLTDINYSSADKAIVDSVADIPTALADGLFLKVDKVAGQGLSTNDYDNTAKGIVDSVTDDLALKQPITDNTLNTTSKTVPGAINELNTGKQANLTAGLGININSNTIKNADSFELINTITATSDVSQIIVNVDSAGNPFKLKRLIIVLSGTSTVDLTSNSDFPAVVLQTNSNIISFVSSNTAVVSAGIYASSPIFNSAMGYLMVDANVQSNHVAYLLYGAGKNNATGIYYKIDAAQAQRTSVMNTDLANFGIDYIRIALTTANILMKSGTFVKIYGVRL